MVSSATSTFLPLLVASAIAWAMVPGYRDAQARSSWRTSTVSGCAAVLVSFAGGGGAAAPA